MFSVTGVEAEWLETTGGVLERGRTTRHKKDMCFGWCMDCMVYILVGVGIVWYIFWLVLGLYDIYFGWRLVGYNCVIGSHISFSYLAVSFIL